MKKTWGRLLLCPLILSLVLACAATVGAEDNAPVADAGGSIAEEYGEAKGVLQAGQLFVHQEEELIDNGDGTYTVSGNASHDVPAGFEAYIVSQLNARNEAIDIKSYGIHKDDLGNMYGAVLNRHPELFFVKYSYNVMYYVTSLQTTTLKPSYQYTAAQVATMRPQFDTEINKIVAKVDPTWSQIEKALFLHDYLATHAEYTEDYYDAYNFVVNKKGVCQSYAMTYTYLLSKVGVTSKVVTSDVMNHAWNMIYLNGQWYQVDLTWDDPRMLIDGVKHDFVSRVKHTNFLRSQSKFISECGHEGTDWIDIDGNVMGQATATNYDTYFWSSATTAIPCYNGYWFFINRLSDTSAEIRAYRFNTNTSAYVYPFNYLWESGEYYYTNKFSGLSMTDGFLIFNNANSIYAMDISKFGQTGFTANPSIRYNKTTADSANGVIYGCVADGLTVTYELRSDLDTDSTPVRKTTTITLPVQSTGVTVSGTVNSYSSRLVGTEAPTTIKLYKSGTTTLVKQTSVVGTGAKSYSFTAVPAGTYTIKISKAKHTTREYTITVGTSNLTKNMVIQLVGDTNGDGSLNAIDLTGMKRFISAKTSVFDSGDADTKAYRKLVADVNSDGKINVLDVTQLLRYICGRTSIFDSMS